jgi:hypothetical protein
VTKGGFSETSKKSLTNIKKVFMICSSYLRYIQIYTDILEYKGGRNAQKLLHYAASSQGIGNLQTDTLTLRRKENLSTGKKESHQWPQRVLAFRHPEVKEDIGEGIRLIMEKRIRQMLIWRQRKIIGLDIDEGLVVATELTKRQGELYLTRFAVTSDLKELTRDPYFKGANVIISLPTQVVLFRSFSSRPALKSAKSKQKDIIAFLSRQNLPFKLEDCFWSAFNLDNNFNLIAAKKEVVERLITQVQEYNFYVLGVTSSLVALYNVLILAYPGRQKDRFVLLNIRNSSSDLIIYESKRLWAYPLSMGKRNLSNEPETQSRFSIEVQRLFNAHYIQNPQGLQKPNYFYLCGQDSTVGLISSLKNVLGDFEVAVLDPLKNLNISTPESITNLPRPSCHKESLSIKEGRGSQIMSLSLGLGFTYLRMPFALDVNLIEGKIKKEKFIALFNQLRKVSFYFSILVITCLLAWNIFTLKNLRKEISIYKRTTFEISSILPKIKVLKEEKERLQKLQDFLEKKLRLQKLSLRALAMLSEARPQTIEIKELDVQMKDKELKVFLSGNTPTYQEINNFLARLKKNQNIKEAKVVASTFAMPGTESKEINFKLRFEVLE